MLWLNNGYFLTSANQLASFTSLFGLLQAYGYEYNWYKTFQAVQYNLIFKSVLL